MYIEHASGKRQIDRHPVYVGATIDHHKDGWDWIWQGIASELGLQQRLDSPLRQTILKMMA